MLSDYQLKSAEDYNISIDNVKKLIPNFLARKSMSFITKTCDFI